MKYNLLPVVTKLGGVEVWGPALESGRVPLHSQLSYGGSLAAQMVKPGGETPATAGSVTVEVIEQSASLLVLDAYDERTILVGQTVAPIGTGPHGGELLTVTAPDISWFVIESPYIGTDSPPPDPWGIAGIEFTPTAASAPEPCSLALAGVGMAIVAGWGLRRRRAPAASAL